MNRNLAKPNRLALMIPSGIATLSLCLGIPWNALANAAPLETAGAEVDSEEAPVPPQTETTGLEASAIAVPLPAASEPKDLETPALPSAIANPSLNADPIANSPSDLELPSTDSLKSEIAAPKNTIPFNLPLSADKAIAPDNPMSQVTSVSQLSDVQPTDWAFQALQSLVERYGCIAGYPDGTYRGNRALSRYEFAAGVNACLEQINQQIGSATANFATREDVLLLQRLQEEFAAELATLRGRTDALEARTSELEANQFSTTTKLYGSVYFSLTGTTASDKVKAEGTSPFTATRDDRDRPIQRRVDVSDDITFSQLVWLGLNTSFTGRDSLFMLLAAGNGSGSLNQYVSAGQTFTTGIPFTVQTSGPEANQLIVRDFYYSFPVGDTLRVILGPRLNWYSHFDENVFAPYTLTGLSSFNSINNPLFSNPSRGSGAVVEWYPNRFLEVHAGYMAENEEFLPGVRTAADPSKGLFGRSNVFTAELTVKPSTKANIRLTYSRQNLPENGLGQVDARRPIAGILDDGPGGRANGGLGGATTDVVGVNFDWLLSPRFGLFGRYGYASTHLQVKDGPDRDVNVQAFQVGMAFPDLGKQGALGTLSFLVPMDIVKGRQFFVSGAGNGGTQYEIEANYFLPLTDHIGISPAIYVIGNLNNFSDNPTVFLGHLRTHFTF